MHTTAKTRPNQILLGLNLLKKHVYEGTVPAATVDHRRKTDKAARAARRIGRR